MVLTNRRGTVLDNYYGTTAGLASVGPYPAPVAPCDESTTHCIWSSPYDLQETIYWIIKMLVLPGLVSVLLILYVILPTFENPIFELINSILTPIGSVFILIWMRESIRTARNRIPNNQLVVSGTVLNKIENPKYKIGFVGDIMMMNNHDLRFDQAVKQFFSDTEFIIGNLEGIVINADCRGSQQRHKSNILPQLVRVLSPNKKWFLCLSNNHSIDYGNLAFHKSLIKVQKNPMFDVFGRNDVTNVFVQEHHINIATGTEWSNQNSWACTARYRNAELWTYHDNVTFHDDNHPLNGAKRFNILFPHWGYENERYVRKRIQKDAKALTTAEEQSYTRYQKMIRNCLNKEILPDPDGRKWDLIFGHHSHTPQPIMKVEDTTENQVKFHKLIAFSGGNFTSGANIIRRKKHIYGTIVKCDIGPLKDCRTQLAVGKVEWKTTVNERDSDDVGPYKTVKIYTRTYRRYAHYLWSLLFSVGIALLIYILSYIDSIL